MVPYFRLELSDEEVAAVERVLRSGWLTTGAEVAAFEREFAAALGEGLEAVAVNSNTAGMHLALEALGIGPGDQVLVPTLTFTATAEVVCYLGADPIFVDVDPQTLCIDVNDAARRLTANTKAIMPVHFAGRSADMRAIKQLADAHGLAVVEDAAHSFPATHEGTPVGAWGSAACVFSFYANKTITTGEGGMIVTADPRIAARCRIMRLHGIDRDAFDRYTGRSSAWRYDVIGAGYKYNLTDVAAALGRVQLSRAEPMRAHREKIARSYLGALRDCPLNLPEFLPAGDVHAWHLFPVSLVERFTEKDRAKLAEHLDNHGIGYSVHYTPLHRLTYWRERYGLESADYPCADAYFQRCLSLPIHSSMRSDELEAVTETIKKFFNA